MSLLCSVIILTYKQLNWLPATLQSVVSQDYKNMEIVISDDGTPEFDNSKIQAVCHKYCSSFGIRYTILHSSSNQGTVRNFNNGLRIAKGDIIIPMAGDNQFYDIDAVSSIVSSYQKNRWLIATGKQMLYKNDLPKELRPYSNELLLIMKTNPEKLAVRLAMLPCFIGGAVTCYAKEVFVKYGFFDEQYKLLEDCPYYINYLIHGERIDFINKILIRHNLESGVHKRNPLLIKDDISVIESLLESDFRINAWQRKMLNYRIICLERELGKIIPVQYKYLDCKIRVILYRLMVKINQIIQHI